MDINHVWFAVNKEKIHEGEGTRGIGIVRGSKTKDLKSAKGRPGSR
jgi:hypothetical protein